MKAIMFGVVFLLAIIRPVLSLASVALPAHQSELIQHKSSPFSYNYQNKVLLGDYQITEEDDDEASNSKKKNAYTKIIYSTCSFVTCALFFGFLQNVQFSGHPFYIPPPTFISLSVFRL